MKIDRSLMQPKKRNTRRGEDSPVAKASEDLVRAIRAAHEEGHGYLRISRAVGLSPAQVQRICKRKAWAHVR